MERLLTTEEIEGLLPAYREYVRKSRLQYGRDYMRKKRQDGGRQAVKTVKDYVPEGDELTCQQHRQEFIKYLTRKGAMHTNRRHPIRRLYEKEHRTPEEEETLRRLIEESGKVRKAKDALLAKKAAEAVKRQKAAQERFNNMASEKRRKKRIRSLTEWMEYLLNTYITTDSEVLRKMKARMAVDVRKMLEDEGKGYPLDPEVVAKAQERITNEDVERHNEIYRIHVNVPARTRDNGEEEEDDMQPQNTASPFGDTIYQYDF